jgi:hypothetical protein
VEGLHHLLEVLVEALVEFTVLLLEQIAVILENLLFLFLLVFRCTEAEVVIN